MKKIKTHILKIKKWNQEWDKIEEEKRNLLNKIKSINETETENTQQITSNNLKPPRF